MSKKCWFADFRQVKENNKYFFLTWFSTILYITSKFSFAKTIINTFFWLWITSRSTFFRWLLLTFLLFCKFHLKWIPINWTFKGLSLVLNQQTIYQQSATLSVWPQSHTVWHRLGLNIVFSIHDLVKKNINYLCSWRFSILTDQDECIQMLDVRCFYVS